MRPPEGAEGEEPETPCVRLWHAALPLIAKAVNKPTFEAHIRTLLPVSLSDGPEPLPHVAEGESTRVLTLQVASPFTRDWLEKRHVPLLNAVLSQVVGEPVAVCLVLPSAR